MNDYEASKECHVLIFVSILVTPIHNKWAHYTSVVSQSHRLLTTEFPDRFWATKVGSLSDKLVGQNWHFSVNFPHRHYILLTSVFFQSVARQSRGQLFREFFIAQPTLFLDPWNVYKFGKGSFKSNPLISSLRFFNFLFNGKSPEY